jgi:hypothetical protein
LHHEQPNRTARAICWPITLYWLRWQVIAQWQQGWTAGLANIFTPRQRTQWIGLAELADKALLWGPVAANVDPIKERVQEQNYCVKLALRKL